MLHYAGMLRVSIIYCPGLIILSRFAIETFGALGPDAFSCSLTLASIKQLNLNTWSL